MRMTRFEPWSLMNLDRHHLTPFAARRMPLIDRSDAEKTDIDWIPAVDIVEEDQRFVLRADLPGVAAEAIDINMDKSVLTLSGERTADKPVDEMDVHRSERRTGKFRRQFSLPDTTSAESIAATCRNGILEISIPKQAEAQSRRITVEVD